MMRNITHPEIQNAEILIIKAGDIYLPLNIKGLTQNENEQQLNASYLKINLNYTSPPSNLGAKRK
jgi:hypothetical protein